MCGNFTLPAFLTVAVVASGAEVSGKKLIYSFNFSHQTSESLVSICRASVAHTCVRGNQRNQIPQRKLSDWNCIWFCKDLSCMGRWRCSLHAPGGSQPHSGGDQSKFSQRAWVGRREKEGGDLAGTPVTTLLPWARTEMRSRREMKACSCRQGEARNDWERVSEHSPQWCLLLHGAHRSIHWA